MAEWRIREGGAMIFDLGQEDMDDPRASLSRRGGAHVFVRFYARVECWSGARVSSRLPSRMPIFTSAKATVVAGLVTAYPVTAVRPW